MGRKQQCSADQKMRIVLSVLRGEITQSAVARKLQMSQTTIAKWQKQFLAGAMESLARGENPKPPASIRERELEAQVEELTSAIGEAYVELRVWRRGGDPLPPYDELEVIRTECGVSVQRFCARIGIPRSTYYYWRTGSLHGRPVRRWPSPVVDRIEQQAAECAEHYLPWGHRKICAMLQADGVNVSPSSVARALKRRDLLLPARYLKERRQLAAARRAAFLVTPTRRNRVWQTDFTEFTTTAHGTWRICPVIDYATKTVLAAPVAGTMNGRDAVLSLKEAIGRAETLMGTSLLDDCLDRETGELFPLIIVTDNGAAFRSLDFESFINSRPELTHVRTRNHAPETNGVVERFNRTIKYEHLYRLEIATGDDLANCVDEFIALYNEIRPHEAIQDDVPMKRFLAVPAHLSATESVQKS